MLGMLALLFDLLVSFSVLVTLTTLVMFPTEITLATMTKLHHSSLARLPICQIPSVTL